MTQSRQTLTIELFVCNLWHDARIKLEFSKCWQAEYMNMLESQNIPNLLKIIQFNHIKLF